MLLSLLSVAGEGIGEGVGGRCWVDVGRVVNGGWDGALAQEADHGLPALKHDLGSVHGECV